MAPILVPNTVQLKPYGTIQGTQWVVLLHWAITMGSGPITAAVLNAMCNKFYTDITPRIATDWPSSHILQGVSAVDLSTNTPALGQSTGAAFPGGGTGMQDAASCLVIQEKTSSRYRGGHPRIYWPGLLTSLQANANSWGSSALANWTTAWGLTITDVGSAAITAGATIAVQVVPRYTYSVTDDPVKKKYVRKKTGWMQNDVVYSNVMNPRIGTQRRRLGGR